jgi:hypothetical protein
MTTTGRPTIVQQFGTAPFTFGAKDEKTEITISFEQPFANDHYALTAITTHTACYVVLRERRDKEAVLEIIRTRYTPELSGSISWIGIGDGAL